jgi:hypothetical protein
METAIFVFEANKVFDRRFLSIQMGTETFVFVEALIFDLHRPRFPRAALHFHAGFGVFHDDFWKAHFLFLLHGGKLFDR